MYDQVITSFGYQPWFHPHEKPSHNHPSFCKGCHEMLYEFLNDKKDPFSSKVPESKISYLCVNGACPEKVPIIVPIRLTSRKNGRLRRNPTNDCYSRMLVKCAYCFILLETRLTTISSCCGELACKQCIKQFKKCSNSNNDFRPNDKTGWMLCNGDRICPRHTTHKELFGEASRYTLCTQCAADPTLPLTVCNHITQRGTRCQAKVYPPYTECRWHPTLFYLAHQ